MGLKKCLECEKEVSNKALFCRQCGAMHPTEKHHFLKTCFALFILIALILLFPFLLIGVFGFIVYLW